MVTDAQHSDTQHQIPSLQDRPLLEIVQMATQFKWAIGLTVLLFLIVYYIIMNVVTFKYVAELKVVPTPSNDSLLQGGLGGLAAAAGLSIGRGQAAPPYLLYRQLATSREVASALSTDEAFLKKLFPESWDQNSEQWRRPESSIRLFVKLAKMMLALPNYPWQKPGAADVQKVLENNLDITEDKSASVLTLSFAHADPAFAKDILWRVHTAADSMLRRRSLARADTNILYLSQKLSSTNVNSYRQALVDILTQQEKLRMLASTNVAFAAEPLGPPSTLARPSRPKPILLFLLLTGFGFIAGCALSLIMALRSERRLLRAQVSV